MPNRYETSANPETQYQPGSNDQVLLNKLGITDLEEIEGLEFDALMRFEIKLFDQLATDEKITEQHLRNWHKQWMGEMYEWAGEYRSVNYVQGWLCVCSSASDSKIKDRI